MLPLIVLPLKTPATLLFFLSFGSFLGQDTSACLAARITVKTKGCHSIGNFPRLRSPGGSVQGGPCFRFRCKVRKKNSWTKVVQCLPIFPRRAHVCQTQRKTKGQQLKGKSVSAPFFFVFFRTFWHFSTLFRTFPKIFLQDFFLDLKGFCCCFSSKRRKDNKENKKKMTKPFCTLVVARLFSSYRRARIASPNDGKESFRNK